MVLWHIRLGVHHFWIRMNAEAGFQIVERCLWFADFVSVANDLVFKLLILDVNWMNF